MTQTTGRRARSPAVIAAVAWLATLVALAGLALFQWRIAAAGRTDLAEPADGELVFVAAAATASTVGAVVAARRPQHPVGWLLTALGATIALTALVDTYARFGVLARPGAVPLAAEAAIVGDAMFAPWLVLVALVLYLTPTGRPISPIWGLFAAGTIVAGSATFGLKLVQTSDLDPPMSKVANPWALTGLASIVDLVETVAVLATGIGLILGGVSLLVRFRRANGVERRQLMWVALAAVPLPVFRGCLIHCVRRRPSRMAGADLPRKGSSL